MKDLAPKIMAMLSVLWLLTALTTYHQSETTEFHWLCMMIPEWFYWALGYLVLLFPIVLIAWVGVRYYLNRRRKRLPPGLCPHCAYDLRATPERCPECGHPVPEGHVVMVNP